MCELKHVKVLITHKKNPTINCTKCKFKTLEDPARYMGILLAPVEGIGRGFFGPSVKKRAYYAVMALFWQFLVSSSNHGNF